MRETRAVLSTAGPFARIGEPLVAAAARAGVHYTDLTGEFLWQVTMFLIHAPKLLLSAQARMLERYEATAIETGAKIVFSSGERETHTSFILLLPIVTRIDY